MTAGTGDRGNAGSDRYVPATAPSHVGEFPQEEAGTHELSDIDQMVHYTRKFSFGSAVGLASRLEDVLEQVGVPIQPGSTLERMTLNTWAVMERQRTGVNPTGETDIRRLFGDLAALAELGVQLVAASNHPDFSRLKPHLRLLNQGEASQNRAASVLDQDANKIFELLAACYAMQLGTDVKVDDPQRSDGSNPDVLVTLPEGRLGIACKVLHSSTPQTVLDRVNDGIDQLERAVCDTGFVFLSLKNVLDHEAYWPTRVAPNGERVFTAYSTFDEPRRQLQRELDALHGALMDHVGTVGPIRGLFHGKKAQSIILFYAHVMCGVQMRGAPVPVSLKIPFAINIARPATWFIRRLEQLNRLVRDVPAT